MRVVLDTNVVMSGIFFTGHPYEILKAWRDELVQIVISPEILDEYYRVAKRLIERYPSVDPGPVLALVTANSEIIEAPVLPAQVCQDPDDDKFLACALVSKSKAIVSGDKHLLKLSGYRGIRVLSPSAFVAEYLTGRG